MAAPAPAAAVVAAAPSKPTAAVGRKHERRTMQLDLAGEADEVFPLFGPVREADWAEGWAPIIHFPADASQRPGTVFTVPRSAHGPESIWVMTEYDPKQRRVSYVSVVPGSRVVQIDIAVERLRRGRSVAGVGYTVTAISDAGNAAVDTFVAEFPAMKSQWETAINRALASGKRGGR